MAWPVGLAMSGPEQQSCYFKHGSSQRHRISKEKGKRVSVFFGMVNFCFKKLGCERKTRDNRLVAGRGHRVQGQLCVGGFVCFKWRYLKMHIREIEESLKIQMTE